MRPFLFAAPNQSETVKPQSWDTTFENRDDEKGSVDESTDQSKMLVKLKPKEKSEAPAGLSRKFINKVDHGGDPADVAVGVDGQRSESTREFYYAPGEPGLTRAFLMSAGVNRVDLGVAWVDPQGKVVPVDSSHTWKLLDFPEFSDLEEEYTARIDEMTESEKLDFEESVRLRAINAGWIRVQSDSIDFKVDQWSGVKKFILSTVPKDAWKTSGICLYTVDGAFSGELFTISDIAKADSYEDLKNPKKKKSIKGEFEQPAVDGPADGHEDREGDSNFSRPAQVSKKDKDVRIDRLPKDKSYPSGSPEPPDAADIGMGNMLSPLASLRPFLFDASEKKEVVAVEDPKLRITYIWDYKANRGPESVLVTFEDTFDPNNPQPLGNLQLELGATGWEVHPGSTTKDQELSALALEKLTPALKSIGEKAAKRYSTGEKDDTEAPRKYNLLEDPALEELAPDMANTEKLFTTIPKWEDDTFFADLSKADPATLTMLRQQPKSTEDNKYFSWEFISSEEQAEKAKEDAKNLGFSVGPNEDSLIVRRLPAWTKIEKQVQKLRKENRQ